MATFDISEVNNAVQITENGNFKQFQKGYLSIDDPSNDVILYIIRDGKQQYKINTDTDTITVNLAPFVGDSNDLKDAINPFFFNASSGGGGGEIDTTATHWKGIWSEQTYIENDQVIDGGWLAIANTTTTERPSPQDVGDEENGIDKGKVFTTGSDVSIVKMVHEYTITKQGYFKYLDVKPKFWDLNTVSKITIIDKTSNEVSVINNPILQSDDWNILAINNYFVNAGDVFEVWFELYNSSEANSVDGGWTSNLGVGVPLSQGFNIDNLTVPTVIEISHTDLDNDNRSTELDGVVVDSIINIVETSDVSRNIELKVTGVDTASATSTKYTVDVVGNGEKAIRSGVTCTLNINVPISQPTEYNYLTDYYIGGEPSWATVTTELYYDGVQQLPTKDAYGINLNFQEASFSSDWDIQASSSAGSSGSGSLLPYTTPDGIDANFKGDVYADGDFFAQGNSVIFENQLSLGASGSTPFFSNLGTGEVAYISGSKVDSGVSSPPTYLDRYNPFTKNDPLGQPQPDDSLTFNSTPFVDDLTGENKYYFAVTLTSTNNLISDNWYVRSLTGFTNSYLKAFKGAETDPNANDVFWKTNTNKQIKEKTGLVTDAGGAGIDITYPLGNSFIESVDDVFSYIFIADNNFTVQGQNFGIDIPYTKGDGSEWRESSVSSNSNSYSFQKDYDFDTNTADSDPGSGKLKFNNADLNLATFMYISQFAKNNVDNDSILSTLSSGDCLMVENTQNASNKVKWCLTSDPVKSGNYYKLEGSSASVSGAFAGQMNLITTFFLSEQPSFSTISQNGTASDKNVLIRKADLTVEERNLSFSDITGGSISRSSIIYQYSTTDQFPANTNVYYPFNFGNGSDIITSDLTLSSSGELTVNTTGQYYFRVFGHFGRVGTSGTAKCLFYGEADFGGGWVLIPNGLSKVFMVTNTNDFESFEFETFFTIPAGVKFRYGMVRDSSGNNDGGVYSFVPNYVGASPFPSIGLDISKLVTS